MSSVADEMDAVANFIHEFIEENGYSPTYQEICDACQLSSRSAARRRVSRLVKQGFFYKDGRASRNTRLHQHIEPRMQFTISPPKDRSDSILNELKRRHNDGEPTPNMRELGAAVGLKSVSTVWWYLDRLERKGKIKREKGKDRAIIILEQTE